MQTLKSILVIALITFVIVLSVADTASANTGGGETIIYLGSGTFIVILVSGLVHKIKAKSQAEAQKKVNKLTGKEK